MIIGHTRIIHFLDAIANQHAISHAYLFAGPDGVGKRHTATEFAKWLLGTHQESFASFAQRTCECSVCVAVERGAHPDMRTYSVPLSIDMARDLKRTSSLSPLTASFRAYIIDGAEELGEETANALLKEIEEPRGRSVFFLVARSVGAMLPTLASRSAVVRFSLVSRDEFAVLQHELAGLGEHMAAIAKGRPGYLIRFRDNPDFRKNAEATQKEALLFLKSSIEERFSIAQKLSVKNREEIFQMLDIWIASWREHGKIRAAHSLCGIQRAIKDDYANIQLALAHTAVNILG